MNVLDDSDENLVERAVASDRAAFAALLSRHYDQIFRLAFKWCGNREDAEDVAQDVCIRLSRALAQFDRRSRFSTWLYRVVLNAVNDHHRRHQANQRKLAEWSNEPSRPQVQSAQGEAIDAQLQELWQAVRLLPERQCNAVMLVYGEELSHAEAAQIMGCAEGTVSSNIHDAKKRLKGLLLQEADS